MFNTMALFLILQICIIALMVLVVLFQKSGTDSLAGLSGGGHGLVSGKTSTTLITKLTFFLAIAFMINSLLLAKFTIVNFQSSSDLLKSITGPIPLDQMEDIPSPLAIPQAE